VSKKAKVAVSLNRELLGRIETLRTARPDRPSRSRVVEEALEKWCQEQRRAEIEREIEAYYRALGAEERSEERQWGETAAEAADAVWER